MKQHAAATNGSVQTIADSVGVSKTTAQTGMRWLVWRKLIEAKKKLANRRRRLTAVCVLGRLTGNFRNAERNISPPVGQTMPLSPIATDRLSLRPFTLDDVDVPHAVWTDADVQRYLWDDIVIPRERAVDVVRSHLVSVAASGIGYWVVHRAKDNAVIGFCGFRFIEGSKPSAQNTA